MGHDDLNQRVFGPVNRGVAGAVGSFFSEQLGGTVTLCVEDSVDLPILTESRASQQWQQSSDCTTITVEWWDVPEGAEEQKLTEKSAEKEKGKENEREQEGGGSEDNAVEKEDVNKESDKTKDGMFWSEMCAEDMVLEKCGVNEIFERFRKMHDAAC